ncbi:MAG: type II 3-dehydroquinate dehydratase [Natronohydrobacter sp.]|nr:type II 3-dehydroquinate dehydratase [Natronohydrobacter sp.]
MPKIFILNGPNLNLLGQRQPEIYGHETLDDLARLCDAEAARLGLEVDFRQSNHEGALVDMIHEARGAAQGIILNAGAYTHTSIAIFDALNVYDGPVIEVHISNIHKREPFRHHSYIAARADAMIAGCGTQGYALALAHLAQRLNARA